MRIASIDIGSNTVLLLIAEINRALSTFEPVLNLYRMPRISKGLDRDGSIKESSIETLIKVLQEYTNVISDHKCDKILVNATQALRVAKNSDSILRRIKSTFGLKVEVISGEREAFLSFLGAQSSFGDFSISIVIDIGGASTEVICGTSSEIIFQKSFPVGVVTMTEKYSLTSVENRDIDDFNHYLSDQLGEIKKLNKFDAQIIAVAGTPTTLAASKQNLREFSEDKVEGYQLANKDLNNFIDSFLPLTPAEIRAKFGKIIEGRQDIILAGTVILSTILKLLKKDYLYSSGRGLRYGAVIDYLDSRDTGA